MAFALEKRGYVRVGPWSPECTLESPEAGQDYSLLSCPFLSFFILDLHKSHIKIQKHQKTGFESKRFIQIVESLKLYIGAKF